MLIGDLVDEVRNEIDDVRRVDIVLAVNAFIREHAVDKAVSFVTGGRSQAAGGRETDAGGGTDFYVTPSTVTGGVDISNFDYGASVYTYNVVVENGEWGSRFELPGSIITLKELHGCNFELVGGRVIEVPRRFGGESPHVYSGVASVVMPSLSLEVADTVSIPYPDVWMPCIVDFVYAYLYKGRYFNVDKAAFREGEYRRKLQRTWASVAVVRESVLKL